MLKMLCIKSNQNFNLLLKHNAINKQRQKETQDVPMYTNI